MEAKIIQHNLQTEKTRTGLEVDIVDLSNEGRGVARVGGKAVFVDGALAGERVKLGRVQMHRRYDEAEVDLVLRASKDRVEPRCAHFSMCAGCVLQHMDPAAQIVSKQDSLLENLKRIGEVEPRRILPALTAAHWGYRRRGRLSVRYVNKKERALVGFREKNGRYVADIQNCDVIDARLGTQVESIARLIEKLEAKYDIPQIEFAAADHTVALVFRHLNALSEKDQAELVAFAKANHFSVFLQPGGNDSVHPLWPEHVSLSFRMPKHNIDFAFEPLDFIQVNGPLNLLMIDHAMQLLEPKSDDRVLDLFCGLGNFTLPIAKKVGSIVGVEGEAGLIARARHNADKNQITNAEYFTDNLFESQSYSAWHKRDFNKIVFDPPRAGAEMMCTELPGKKVERIVYVSCHPASLARDAGILVKKHGFKLQAAGVMDMFPHTAHVESIALFQR